jgi:hypothetical protein
MRAFNAIRVPATRNAHHQRGEGRQPRRVRNCEHAARYDRVGMILPIQAILQRRESEASRKLSALFHLMDVGK